MGPEAHAGLGLGVTEKLVPSVSMAALTQSRVPALDWGMPSALSKRRTVFQVTPDRSAKSAADIPSKALAARILSDEIIDRSYLE